LTTVGYWVSPIVPKLTPLVALSADLQFKTVSDPEVRVLYSNRSSGGFESIQF